MTLAEAPGPWSIVSNADEGYQMWKQSKQDMFWNAKAVNTQLET